jgi:esterase/lipase superfamily enzyme
MPKVKPFKRHFAPPTNIQEVWQTYAKLEAEYTSVAKLAKAFRKMKRGDLASVANIAHCRRGRRLIIQALQQIQTDDANRLLKRAGIK